MNDWQTTGVVFAIGGVGIAFGALVSIPMTRRRRFGFLSSLFGVVQMACILFGITLFIRGLARMLG